VTKRKPEHVIALGSLRKKSLMSVVHDPTLDGALTIMQPLFREKNLKRFRP